MTSGAEEGAPSRFVSLDTLNDEEKRKEQELKEVYEWYVDYPPDKKDRRGTTGTCAV